MAEGGSLGGLFYQLGFHTDTAPLEKVEHLIEGVQHRLEFLGAAEVVRGIYEMTEKFSAFAEQLNSSAAAAGLGVEQLQGVQFAASQSAVSAEQMNHALGHLARSLNAARQGGKEATEAFAAVGITPGQLAGFANSEQALEAVADSMRNMHDPIRKAALLQQLMGRGSANMAMFLSKGGAAIRGLTAEASRMGAVLSQKDVHALAEVEDALSAMGQVIKVAGAQVAAAFAPSIEYAVKQMINFYAANRKVITQHINDWVYKVTFAFGFLFAIVRNMTQAVLDFADAHPMITKWAGYVLLAFMGASLGLVALRRVLGLASFGFAQFAWALTPLRKYVLPLLLDALAAVGGALLALPTTLLIAGMVIGISSLVLVIQALWETLYKGKPFSGTWLAQLSDMVGKFGSKVLRTMGFEIGTPEGAAPAAEALDFAAPDASLDGPAPAYKKDSDAEVSSMLGKLGRLLPPQMQGQAALLGEVGVMAGMQMPATPAMAAFAGGPQAAAAQPAGAYTLNAPVTINVPPGGDSQAIAAAVQKALGDHMGRVHREAVRGLQPAQVN